MKNTNTQVAASAGDALGGTRNVSTNNGTSASAPKTMKERRLPVRAARASERAPMIGLTTTSMIFGATTTIEATVAATASVSVR